MFRLPFDRKVYPFIIALVKMKSVANIVLVKVNVLDIMYIDTIHAI